MRNKSFSKNILVVGFSRVISLLASVATGLLIPKMFSVADYGYFKVFTLYAVYTALLHFGFVDGILLKLAGKNYSELDRARMTSYTGFFILFEVLISLTMIVVGVFFASGEYLFIIIMLAVNMVLVNVTTYYQFISQATQRFIEYSAKSVIASLAKLILVGALFAAYFFNVFEVSYRTYVVGVNSLDLIMMLWYVLIYRDITFGKRLQLSLLKRDILGIFKTGIVLTAAYQVSHLVLALDRQFVNVLFTTEEFAVYSFAYNIVSMVSTVVSSLAVVLLPMLKKVDPKQMPASYQKSITVVSVIVGGSLLCYFPLIPFIEWFLPNYTDSLEYIRIVMPTLLFTAGTTVVMFTVDKVLDMNMAFFKNSCIVLALGLITNAAAYATFRTPQSISYASLLVMAIWFLIEGIRLGRHINVSIIREFVYLVFLTTGFLATTALIGSPLGGGLIYGGFFMAVTTLMFGRILLGERKTGI